MMESSQSSKVSAVPGSAGSNLRTLAQLFKLDLHDMFNAWETSKPLRTGMPHASAILASDHDFCLRQLVLQAVYPDAAVRPDRKPWDAHQNAVFLNGWVLHEKYQNLFTAFAKIAEIETSHYDEERMIHFTPDAIIEHMGETMIVEIKGYKQEHFSELDEYGLAPVAAHIQANFYMHLLRLQHALILVECKNCQDYKVWCVEYNRGMVQPQLDRIYAFKAAMTRAERKLPERTCMSVNDRNAQKCAVCKLCFQ